MFAEQISSKQSLNRDCAQNDISTQQKISSYPDFRLWLKSIDIRQTLSIVSLVISSHKFEQYVKITYLTRGNKYLF